MEEVLRNPWYFTDNTPLEFDQPVSEFFQKDDGFEYEKAQASEYFKEKKVKVSKNKRNAFVKNNGMFTFSDAGTGICVVDEPEFAGMNHKGYYIEYTADKGKTWKICGAYYASASVDGIWLAGNRVYILMVSEAAMEESEKSYFLYSDDLCEHFYIRDPITLLPDYAELMYCHTRDVAVLDFNKDDGAMTLGWSDDEFRKLTHEEGEKDKFFLTAKFNGELTKGAVMTADNEYIRNSAEEISGTK